MSLNILFLSLLDFNNLDESNIYTDLLNEFIKNQHHVSIISPSEKRKQSKETHLIKIGDNCEILKLRIGNITKTSFLEKGISTILLENKFISGIKKFFRDKQFDLVIYSTPPVTFANVIKFIKRRDNCKSYLLLKDIFPQNAVDLNILKDRGLLYNFFRYKEKKLYKLSDYIGTMSKANSDYIKKHNSFRKNQIVEINPNTIKTDTERCLDDSDIKKIRSSFGISDTSILLLYGGNLGKPQGIDFLLNIVLNIENQEDLFFAIIGSGTEFTKIENFLKMNKTRRTKLFDYMPKEQYEVFEKAADIGVILLDKRFTVPNVPSRLLGYMKHKKPILAATDRNTDLKDMIREGNFGLWSEHGDVLNFMENINKLTDKRYRMKLGQNGNKYFKENFDVEVSYSIILNHFDRSEDVVQK